MSFRARLRLFFVLLVIVPMVVLALVLFALVERSEIGKTDAGLSAASRTAFGIYDDAAERAEPALRRVARDPALRAALQENQGVRQRMRELAAPPGGIVAITLHAPDRERRVVGAGSPIAVAPSGAPLSVEGQTTGILSVSLVEADEFAARVRELSGLDAAVYRGDRLLAATVDGLRGPPREGDFEVRGDEYRGRVDSVGDPAGPAVELAIFERTDDSETIAESRLVIGGLIFAFLLLAALAAAAVSRALTGQIGEFLEAARRLARGDFTHPIPVQGNDEFAQLGREFNSMSEQLEAKIEEVERKRRELEETIRRVGDALATGLDRDGVVALAVRQAVDACEAEAGRARPLRADAFREVHSGDLDERLADAIGAAERDAFADDAPPAKRHAVAAQAGDAHALAMPLRAVTGSADPEYLGVLSIARRGREFTRGEGELLEYLAGQAVVSIENASLHETVERQAVTDELTGLANARAFRSILEREVERSRRFDTPLSLVMVDLDRFKLVNDEYGHQQGDEVLASVAAVLRRLSRDIDAPARYGGEELAVVVPQTDSDGAAQLAERMREAIEALRVARVGAHGFLQVTASFGVAAMPENASDGEELVAAADAALYRAKRGGRNRVERADPVPAAG